MDIPKIIDRNLYYCVYVRKHGRVASRCWLKKSCFEKFVLHIAKSSNYFLISYGSLTIRYNRFALEEAK